MSSFIYIEGCGHCKKMKPEYEQAAERLKAEQVCRFILILTWQINHQTISCDCTAISFIYVTVTCSQLLSSPLQLNILFHQTISCDCTVISFICVTVACRQLYSSPLQLNILLVRVNISCVMETSNT